MALNAASATKECTIEDNRILCLLVAKVHGKRLPNYAITVHECDDLYGDTDMNPWDIWEAFRGGDDNNNNNGSRELYFFTTFNMKSSRTIGLGSWEDQHNDVIIVAKGTNQRVAVKKCLRFDKSGTNHDGAWIMHEYSLDSSLIRTPPANYNYVLCKLIKNLGRERITRQEVTNRPRTRLSTRLARAAASTNKNGGLTPIKNENRKLPEMVGDKKTKVEEKTDDGDYEEHVDDNLSWPQFLSKQLIKSNKGAVKQEEEDMELLPNPFARDLLLERLDIKYFGISK